MNEASEHERARAGVLAALARNRGEIDAERLGRLLERLDPPRPKRAAASSPAASRYAVAMSGALVSARATR
jgi:hypothetical protein